MKKEIMDGMTELVTTQQPAYETAPESMKKTTWLKESIEICPSISDSK